MNDFFSELKRFVEEYRTSPIDDMYLMWEGSRIYYPLALYIYQNYFILQADHSACLGVIAEQRDFIRLLREENARLRGETDE